MEEFNKETKNNKKMDKYKNLLTEAIDNVLGKVEDEQTMDLFNFGGFENLVSSSSSNNDEFDIISYLIIN